MAELRALIEARAARRKGNGHTVAEDAKIEVIREAPTGTLMAAAEKQFVAQSIMDRLTELRTRCQRQTNSFITPMGDEMFYRYQQSWIDDATTTVGALLRHSKAQQSPNRID